MTECNHSITSSDYTVEVVVANSSSEYVKDDDGDADDSAMVGVK